MRALCLALLVACADSSTTTVPPQPSKPTAHRRVTRRAELPAALQPVVPAHGLYAAGGGLTSAPWRVVVDTDASTIYGGASVNKTGASSIGAQDKEATRPLAAADKARLVALGNDAWVEPPPSQPAQPIADYDEILIVADGDDTFYLEGFGPIRQPIAAKTIAALRSAAGL